MIFSSVPSAGGFLYCFHVSFFRRDASIARCHYTGGDDEHQGALALGERGFRATMHDFPERDMRKEHE